VWSLVAVLLRSPVSGSIGGRTSVGDENWPPGHTLAQPPPTELRPLVVRLQAAAVSAGSREAELADDIYQALAKLQTIYDDQPDVDQWDRAATERVEALTETWWQAARTLESHVRKKAL
jgi:hypothetical protein